MKQHSDDKMKLQEVLQVSKVQVNIRKKRSFASVKRKRMPQIIFPTEIHTLKMEKKKRRKRKQFSLYNRKNDLCKC